MSDRKPRNTTSPIPAPVAFSRLMDRIESRVHRREKLEQALKDFDAAEASHDTTIIGRVPVEERERLKVLLMAYPEAKRLAEKIVV